jgi:uncharacterized protein (TIGR02679 family)
MNVPDAVRHWASLPGPAAVLFAVRLRARRGHRTESGTLATLALDRQQRNEVAQLLGTPWKLSGRPVRLQDLAARLAEHGLSVRDLVEAMTGGPIEEHRTEQARAAAAAAAERAETLTALVGCGVEPEMAERWLTDSGLPAAGTGELARLTQQIALVWQRLPHHAGSVRLAQLAATALHDAHTLDADRPLGRAVARLAATVHSLDRPQRAGRLWRRAWQAVGVQCDAVSSRVLVLNLPLRGEAPAVRLCAASPGEPLWLTLRSLTEPWTVDPGDSPVFVCENVTVVEAAADALGHRCPPLVCTDGIAFGAALDLIAGLATACRPIHARADFDPAGFTILDQVRSVAPGAIPWRFDSDTYTTVIGVPMPHSKDTNTETVLQQLRITYGTHGRAIHEEQLLDQLLSDLHAAANATIRPSPQPRPVTP